MTSSKQSHPSLQSGSAPDELPGGAEKAPTAPSPSEEQFRMLVASVQDYAIFMLSPEGVVQSWNAGAERIKGYRAEEIIGQHFSRFYAPEDLAAGKAENELMVATRDGRYEEEGWRVRKDGSRFWASVVLTSIRDARGELRGFAKVTRDLTERRKAEDELRASEEHFRLLVTGVTDYAMFMLDPAGHVVTWNTGAERIKGYRAEEIIGQHFSRFYTPEDLATNRPAAELEIATRVGKYEEEGWRLRKDGSPFWANVLITAIYGSAGEFRGFAKVTRDLTERRESERIKSIVDNVVDGIITFDETGLIESINRAAEGIFGYSAAEVLGRNVAMLAAEPQHINWVARSAAASAVQEAHGRRKDGSVFTMELAIGAFHFQGRRAYTGVVRDVTQRKQAEAQLRFYADELRERNAELAQSNQELDEFAYIASHDLKEPLRGIHNYSTFLLEDYSDKLDADGKAKLETLARLAQRMEQLINSLLQFSRVGRVELAREPTDLNRLVEMTLDALQITLQETRVEVRIPRPLPTVTCDHVRVGEVFQNLIGNSVKYNDKSERWVEVGYVEEAGEPTTFYVRDNGIGIPAKHFEAIFRIFKRLHGRDKFGGGTGVGLTIVKKIVERHGGRIWIESTPGEGTTFFFTLSAKEVP